VRTSAAAAGEPPPQESSLAILNFICERQSIFKVPD
jgi:hypothetical protein